MHHQKGISIIWIIIIVIVLVVVAFGLLVVYYYFQTNKNGNNNVNQNVNQAYNVNINQNTNTNLNQNINNANQNTNTGQAQAIDADQDGLVDSYEPVFRANINAKDTDADGYSDAIEVFNGYKPYTTGKLFKNDLRKDLVPKPKIISVKEGDYFEGQLIVKFRDGIPFEQALNLLIAKGLAYIPMMLEGPDLQNVNSKETVLYSDSFFFPTSHQLQVAVPNGQEKSWSEKLSKESIVESTKLNLVTKTPGINVNINVNASSNTNANTNTNVNQP